MDSHKSFPTRIVLMMFYLLLCCKVSYAKGTDSAFVPMPVTIFEDNFQSDPIGAFPKHWWISYFDSAKYKKFSRVRYVRGRKALVIDSVRARGYMGGSKGQSGLGQIGPKMASIQYLPDNFTLEFDFALCQQPQQMQIVFSDTNADYTSADWVFEIFVYQNKHHNYHYEVIRNAGITYDIYETGEVGDTPIQSYINLDTFNYNGWNHLALSCKGRRVTCYLDGKKVFITPVFDRNPRSFVFGYDAADSIAYTNFRIATDNNSEANFNRLLAENKFTTHAILFDVNKADIKPESTAFVKQLAEWLKANPTIKLEIDGHTDSDGGAAANKLLSQKRADAVKQLLVSFGISESRLTTKGYGDTKPIKPNTTSEGKAENRRVEFIKITSVR